MIEADPEPLGCPMEKEGPDQKNQVSSRSEAAAGILGWFHLEVGMVWCCDSPVTWDWILNRAEDSNRSVLPHMPVAPPEESLSP